MEAEYMPAFEVLGNTFRALPTQSYTINELDMAKGAKKTRLRAPRIPVETWEKMRPTICEEYMTKTLEELVSFLKVEHDFSVKKRQLVYRLGIWECGKYHNNTKGLRDEQSNGDSDLDDEELGTDDGHFNEVTDALELTSCFEAGSYAYDQVNRNIQAATAIFAAGGGCGGLAWTAYKDGYLNTKGHANRLVALCRSAETEQQFQEALEVLRPHKLQSGDQRILMYVHVLESMNDERCRNDKFQLQGPMARNVADAVSSILDRSGKGFLLKEDGTVDLFAFHLLDVIYERYSACLDTSQEDKLRILLDCLEGWVLSRDRNGATTSAALDTLRECVQWCSQRLEEVCTDFAQTKQTRRPKLRFPHSQDDLIWKEHLEVYGTLWYRLTLQQEAEKAEEGVKNAGEEDSAGWLGWACHARNDLGISHAEVLSYVCWVLVNYEANSTTGHGTGTVDMTTTANGYHGGSAGNEYNESSPESLFLRVKAAANVMNGAEPSILWHRFLYAFKEFNDLTGGNDEFGDVAARAAEYKRFRGGIVAEFASFVREALSEFQDFKPGEARDCSCYPR
ncbi:hypothetical protein CLIM01_11191 [Colletotrichum limetticola]|uniref:Clr5 domain-containing protein n=1 Tax=Colletotrichum limetticola TaxID=1209924 RepID=A0ABQ9PI11_9PEZI|nr:hypothetical protein CLIM01_11191 [Colletotrichum limetticola]